jgi:hypothetical protein
MLGVTVGFAIALPLLFLLSKLDDLMCRETRLHLKKAASMSPAMRRRYLQDQIEFCKSERTRKSIERTERALARRERFPFKQFHACRVRFCNIRRFFFPSL